ncbi:uncharacterized protein AMSG_11886 [Thecamonas trahens ATCC 50062]|uniref:Ribosomal RNA large subunit methyltransferase K/L-like methyltransferase domain-containing protein n=1 Tax=Thecamonas trahens ATCC 50062 TaxID=461836 RepID=A0A0L0DB98_THETB|nr:hypothetical protein AMSG_11886 [Thecamonas trahens ATCC 50062]KNC49525.1 hypothetical protein AMSG_11886 [Thecamonas trahens ATCC 50062]|eukprot:XP_013757760.1 hypothetical protein AMSG_11886 [Thecamonas trahens ATCC 50062]
MAPSMVWGLGLMQAAIGIALIALTLGSAMSSAAATRNDGVLGHRELDRPICATALAWTVGAGLVAMMAPLAALVWLSAAIVAATANVPATVSVTGRDIAATVLLAAAVLQGIAAQLAICSAGAPAAPQRVDKDLLLVADPAAASRSCSASDAENGSSATVNRHSAPSHSPASVSGSGTDSLCLESLSSEDLDSASAELAAPTQAGALPATRAAPSPTRMHSGRRGKVHPLARSATARDGSASSGFGACVRDELRAKFGVEAMATPSPGHLLVELEHEWPTADELLALVRLRSVVDVMVLVEMTDGVPFFRSEEEIAAEKARIAAIRAELRQAKREEVGRTHLRGQAKQAIKAAMKKHIRNDNEPSPAELVAYFGGLMDSGWAPRLGAALGVIGRLAIDDWSCGREAYPEMAREDEEKVRALAAQVQASEQAQAGELAAWAELDLTFKISAHRAGTKTSHTASSQQLSASWGSVMCDACPGWKASMLEHLIELEVFVFRDWMCMAVPLLPPRTRLVQSRVAEPLDDTAQGSSLQPSVAYGLIDALGPLPHGAVVVDVTGGAGIIALEGASSAASADAVFVSGELARVNCETALSNRDELAAGRIRDDDPPQFGAAELVQWDASMLPLRSATIDGVIADLPFGHRCGRTSQLRGMYVKLVGELARVLVPGTGRAVLFTPQFKLLVPALARSPAAVVGLMVVSMHAVNLSNMMPFVVVVQAVSSADDVAAATAAAPPASAPWLAQVASAETRDERAKVLQAWAKAERKAMTELFTPPMVCFIDFDTLVAPRWAVVAGVVAQAMISLVLIGLTLESALSSGSGDDRGRLLRLAVVAELVPLLVLVFLLSLLVSELVTSPGKGVAKASDNALAGILAAAVVQGLATVAAVIGFRNHVSLANVVSRGERIMATTDSECAEKSVAIYTDVGLQELASKGGDSTSSTASSSSSASSSAAAAESLQLLGPGGVPPPPMGVATAQSLQRLQGEIFELNTAERAHVAAGEQVGLATAQSLQRLQGEIFELNTAERAHVAAGEQVGLATAQSLQRLQGEIFELNTAERAHVAAGEQVGLATAQSLQRLQGEIFELNTAERAHVAAGRRRRISSSDEVVIADDAYADLTMMSTSYLESTGRESHGTGSGAMLIGSIEPAYNSTVGSGVDSQYAFGPPTMELLTAEVPVSVAYDASSSSG